MSITFHHKPVDPTRAYKIHVWDGRSTWDLPGTRGGKVVDFVLTDVDDLRKLLFMFHSTDPRTNQEVWESDDFIRRVRVAAPAEIWSFDSTARILYRDPTPPGATFSPGDVLTFQVITQNRFKGGRLYAWNPYDPAGPSAFFPESSRSDPVSTFKVPLAAWMTSGFNFKLVGNGPDGKDVWEPDSSNRVWTPGDGVLLWVKSGQVSVHHEELTLTKLPARGAVPGRAGEPAGG